LGTTDPFYGDADRFPGGEPFRARTSDLARHLLLAGSFPTLKQVVRRQMEEKSWGLELILSDYINGSPLPTPLGDELEVSEDSREAFITWWKASSEKLQWDPGRRRFFVGP